MNYSTLPSHKHNVASNLQFSSCFFCQKCLIHLLKQKALLEEVGAPLFKTSKVLLLAEGITQQKGLTLPTIGRCIMLATSSMVGVNSPQAQMKVWVYVLLLTTWRRSSGSRQTTCFLVIKTASKTLALVKVVHWLAKPSSVSTQSAQPVASLQENSKWIGMTGNNPFQMQHREIHLG